MDRNTEIEQYFALWNESFPVAATHDHWVRWGKLLRVWLPSIDGVPMNVEVTGDFPRALKKWTSLELELRLLFLKGSFYKDEEEYYREEKSHMAAESYIPCGTFSPTNDPEFVESPTVLMSGTVLSVEPTEFDGDKICKIELRLNILAEAKDTDYKLICIGRKANDRCGIVSQFQRYCRALARDRFCLYIFAEYLYRLAKSYKNARRKA